MAQILIIDDHPAIVRLLAEFCTTHGHAVDTAQSGHVGLKLVRETLPDVVLVDLRLGDMTGIDLMMKAKADGCSARFVFITGCSEVRFAVSAMKAGAVDYITKPIDLGELKKIIDLAVENRHAGRSAQKLVIVYPKQPALPMAAAVAF